MKKVTIIIGIIILLLSINKESKLIIPNNSIRFRIIANSNKKEDQQLKKQILKNLTNTIKEINSSKNIETTRRNIQKEIPKFTKTVEKTIDSSNFKEAFHINYGKNFFPEKEYKNVIYPAGEYESLVITLGNGTGDNFWCVLFPPLCLVDENNNVEYKSIVKEIIEKYF